MSCWAEDPELFLYKGKDGIVRLLRCKKETTTMLSSMFMKPEDFTDEGVVTDHLSLYGGCHDDWDKNRYEALIDYICLRQLLVNCHGSVIVKLGTDDHKEAAPVVCNVFHWKKKAAAEQEQPVYVRALDILSMRSYGPYPTDRAVPARAVKYLQDGMVVVQTEPVNPKEMKLTEELAIKSNEDHETLRQKLLLLLKDNTVRIYSEANTSSSLTIRNGDQVTVGPKDELDVYQYWMKDEKYGATVKDRWGFPSYALVNKFTHQALKPTDASTVELVPYDPNVLDKSILWIEEMQDDGYRAIRKATNTRVNLDVAIGNGVGEGTIVHLRDWWAVSSQKWNIVPYIMNE